ncbi:TPA: UDP-N-acetylenolpyruvoylglucosamine reductase [Patescibacteria group bacterium]|nr:UDP-N-acetylenolpyruvoylglucosamine reductase [Patescibacteria group bacterium]
MFKTNVKLSDHSNYKIGGEAQYFFQSNKVEEIIKAVKKAKQEKLSIFVLGGGTNLLFDDQKFEGLVIKPTMNQLQQDGNKVVVGAGILVSDLLDFVADKGLAGLEWAGGLPGFVGGAVRGNAGAFKGEMKDSVIEVTSLDISGVEPKIIKRNNGECNFGYRNSIFKEKGDQEIVLEAVLALEPGNKEEIQKVIDDKIAWREARQPLDHPNIGSIFKNVDWHLVPNKWQEDEELKTHLKTDPFPVLPAATLIDKTGLKGEKFGGAMVSPKHPNFIINSNNASAEDVRSLIKIIKERVHDKYDIWLEEEVMIVK